MQRRAPGLQAFLHYPLRWFVGDLASARVLAASLIPVGMGCTEASGLPAIHGLCASILSLMAYAIIRASRIMVPGPGWTLAAVFAAIILPMSGGSAERSLVLA